MIQFITLKKTAQKAMPNRIKNASSTLRNMNCTKTPSSGSWAPKQAPAKALCAWQPLLSDSIIQQLVYIAIDI